MKNKLTIILNILILFSSLMLVGCSDDPNSVGMDLLNPDLINVKEFDTNIDTSNVLVSSFTTSVGYESSLMLTFGDNLGIKASGLIQFNIVLPDTIKNLIKSNTATVTSSFIRLTKIYHQGTNITNSNFFEVKRILSDWNVSNFNVDSLNKLQIAGQDLGTNKVLTDSLLSFNFDQTTASEWMRAASDTNFKNLNKGIILQGVQGSNLIAGFQSLASGNSAFPTLYIVINKPSGIDTLEFTPDQDISVFEGSVSQSGNTFFIQNSVESRSKLWFDISRIPQGAIVNRAELILNLDTLNTVKGRYIDSGYTQPEIISVYMINDSTKIDTLSDFSATLSRNGNVFKGNITGLVQEWMTGKQNQGLLIKPYDIKGVDRFAFYSNASLATRPQLKIIYTIKN